MCGRTHGSSDDKSVIAASLEKALESQSKATGAGGMYKTAAAARLREEGNAAFGRGAYEDAYRLYSQSLESAEDYRTYANRAATLLKQGAAAYAAQPEGFDMITPEIDRIYRAATGDAGRAATLQPSFAKAWYRQAKAQIGETTAAITLYGVCLKLASDAADDERAMRTHGNLAIVYRMCGQLDKALA